MANLQFQSFTNQNFEFGNEGGGSSGGGSYSGKIGDTNFDEANAATAAAGPKKNVFSFAFYQQYFDVDTEQVVKRILNSVIPTHKNYITEFIQPVPDFYGPFWVCVTLIFSIGIFSNIAQYIENRGAEGEYGSDFRMVTGASSLIASYVIIIPFVLYSISWYRKTEIQYSYAELLCAYGYSLAIFIPVSMLWTVDVNWLRWTLIFASVFLSGGVLVRALWPAFQNDPNKMISLGVIIGVIVLHFGLAICFKEYFFDPTSSAVRPPPPPGGEVTLPPHVDPTHSIENVLATLKPGTVGGEPVNASKPEAAAQVAPASLALAGNETVVGEGGGDNTTLAEVASTAIPSDKKKNSA